MDGQKDTATTGTAPDAAETILQQQRGDTPAPTNTTDTVDATETAVVPGAPGQPVVDLAAPDANAGRPVAAPTDDANLRRATIDGENILFDTPGQITTPAVVVDRNGAVVPPTDAAAPAAVPANGEVVVDANRGALRVVDGAPQGPPTPPEVTTTGDPNLRGNVATDAPFDPTYNQLEGNQVKLSPEAEKEIADKMAEFKTKLEGSNYSIQFEKGEGPWNAITRQQNEARAKQKAGKELSPQEQAILGLKPDEVTAEAIKIRDRDFKTMKTEDGKPRTWYKLHEPTSRYSPEQMKEMMSAQEKTLRASAEKAAKEAEAKAREAEAEKQRVLAASIEKNIPAESIIKDAATTAGVAGDPKVIRDNMKAHVAQEVAAGTLSEADLVRPYPRVGAALVGTGALTAEELKGALEKQSTMKTEARAKGEEPPSLGTVLQGIYKDNPEKLAALDKASKFYDEMVKLTDAAIQAAEVVNPAGAPPAPAVDSAFDPRYNELQPRPAEATPAPAAVPPGPADVPPAAVPPGSADAPPPSSPGRVEPTAAAPAPTGDTPPATVTSEDPVLAARRAELLREVQERARPTAGVVTDLKQQPSGYLGLKAFQAAGLDTRNWTATNPAQQALADNLKNPALKAELPKLSADMLDGKASVGDVTPINEFLAGKNIDIKLDPIGKNDIAFAATLGVKGQWAGTATELEVGGKKFPAVDLKGVESYEVNGQTVIKLYTGADGVEVYASPLPEDLPGEEINARAQALTPNGTNSKPGRFTATTIPMVSMDARTELKDLVGMTSDKGETITLAQMQTKLALDQNGFSVEQGLAVVSSRGMAQSFDFDKPFMLWVKTKDGSQPLAAVRVDERFWKDPKGARAAKPEQ